MPEVLTAPRLLTGTEALAARMAAQSTIACPRST
jgi:hypothetical protein